MNKANKNSLCIGVFLCLFMVPAFAGVDTEMSRAILEATKHDTSMTDKEKLYKYRCQLIAKHVGFPDTPTGKALKYSCDEVGIGIAIYAGADLGKHPPEKIGQYFFDKLAEEGLRTEIHIEHNYEHGTGMEFFVNGKSIMSKRLRPSEAIEKLSGLAGDAKLTLLTEERVKTWIDFGEVQY